MTLNKQVVLASRPQGQISERNFRLVESPAPTPGPGEVLVRNHWLSVDPYMRGRMDDGKSYATPQPLDQVMVGGTVGEVVQSNRVDLPVGTIVVGSLGWQLYATSDGRGLRKIERGPVPMSAYLGAVGMPGVTGWIGLNEIIAPKAGETVVVSAASGAVGSVVGQLAKLAGCRAVGIAGGPDKCRAVVEEFGFDACVDYKAGRLREDLAAAAPAGIDGYFENVGGAVLDAVLERMNAFGRIAVCGLISGYDAAAMPIANFRAVLVSRLLVQGFIVSERPASWPTALAQLGELVATRRLKYRESIAEGLESAPGALIGLLRGANFGKQLVKLV